MTATTFYSVPAVLDATDVNMQLRYGGDLLEGARNAVTFLLRAIAALPPACCDLSLLFVHGGASGGVEPQDRMKLYVAVTALAPDAEDGLRLLLEQGPLCRLYPLHRCEPPRLPWDKFSEACDVVRYEELVTPVVQARQNWRVPSVLYQTAPFAPNDNNDYRALDSLCDGLREPVLGHVCVQPVDAREERQALNRYCAELQDVNRGFRGDDDLPGSGDSGLDRFLSSGVPMTPELPQRREPLADTTGRAMQEMRGHFNRPQLLFHCRAFGGNSYAARLTAATMAECAFRDGTYGFVVTKSCDDTYAALVRNCKENRVGLVPALAAQAESVEPRLYAGFGRFSQMASADELSGLARFPVGGVGTLRCMVQTTDPPRLPAQGTIVLGHDLVLDQFWKGSPASDSPLLTARGMLIKDLKRGMALFGMPGYGKTSVLILIMLALYRARIPFFLISPIAGEELGIKRYRDHVDPVIRGLARDLRIYTPGRDDGSPVALNSLARDLRILLSTHIEGVMECFRGSIPMEGPLPGILQEALYRVHWTHPCPDDPPRMSHVVATVEDIVAERGYQGELLHNLRAAIQGRLRTMCQGSLGSMFEPGINDPSIESLASGYSVICLDALPEEEKAKTILFYLKSLGEYLGGTPAPEGPLRLALMVDEGHLIAGPDKDAKPSEKNANPAAYAAKIVRRMMREFRKRDVAFVIADQRPSNVADDVVALAGTKMAFRLTHPDDRQHLGDAMLFTRYEYEQIARLRPGQAFLLAEGFHRPKLIQAVNIHQHLDLSAPPDLGELRSWMEHEPWFQATRREIGRHRLIRLTEIEEEMFKEFSGVIGQVAEVARAYPVAKDRKERRGLQQRATELISRLREVVATFQHGYWERLIGCDVDGEPPELVQARGTLCQTFRTRWETPCQECTNLLETIIKHHVED